MLSRFNYADGVQSTPSIGGKLRTQRFIKGTTQYRSLSGRDAVAIAQNRSCRSASFRRNANFLVHHRQTLAQRGVAFFQVVSKFAALEWCDLGSAIHPAPRQTLPLL